MKFKLPFCTVDIQVSDFLGGLQALLTDLQKLLLHHYSVKKNKFKNIMNMSRIT